MMPKGDYHKDSFTYSLNLLRSFNLFHKQLHMLYGTHYELSLKLDKIDYKMGYFTINTLVNSCNLRNIHLLYKTIIQ